MANIPTIYACSVQACISGINNLQMFGTQTMLESWSPGSGKLKVPNIGDYWRSQEVLLQEISRNLKIPSLYFKVRPS